MPRQGILEGNTSSPCLPTPLARPGQARPPDRTCLLSPPERDGVQEQMESYDSGQRAGPRQVSKRAEIGPDRAHLPRGRGSAPSQLASRTDLGSDTLTQAAPASQPEPEAPRPPKGRRDPAPLRTPECRPTDFLLQGRVTGLTGRSQIAAAPWFTHPRS